MSESARAWGKQAGVHGIVAEFEGSLVDTRGTMADSIKATLPKYADALTHGFLCRHLRFPDSDTVTESIAEELEIRSPSREKLRAALSAVQEKAFGAENGVRPGITEFFAQATQAGLKLFVVGRSNDEAMKKCLGEAAVDANFLTWPVSDENSYIEGWAAVVRNLEFPPGVCLAIVASGAARHSALSAGFRCIAVPDDFTRHHDFSGADTVVDTLADVAL